MIALFLLGALKKIAMKMFCWLWNFLWCKYQTEENGQNSDSGHTPLNRCPQFSWKRGRPGRGCDESLCLPGMLKAQPCL